MHDCIAEKGCTAGVWMLNEDTEMNHFMAAITQHFGNWGGGTHGSAEERKTSENEIF